MSALPDRTLLGKLEFLHVYQEFDGPRVFSCRNKAEQVYLALWADQSDQTDTWLYVPVSDGRLTAVESGVISLQAAFVEPEDGVVIVVQSSLHERDDRTSIRAPDDLPGAWLPRPSAFVTRAVWAVDEPTPIPDFASMAEQTLRDVIGLRVKPQGDLWTSARRLRADSSGLCCPASSFQSTLSPKFSPVSMRRREGCPLTSPKRRGLTSLGASRPLSALHWLPVMARTSLATLSFASRSVSFTRSCRLLPMAPYSEKCCPRSTLEQSDTSASRWMRSRALTCICTGTGQRPRNR